MYTSTLQTVRQIDRQTGQWSCSIGRTILQTSAQKLIHTIHNKNFLERKFNICGQLFNLSAQFSIRQRSECVKQRRNVVGIHSDQQLQHYAHSPDATASIFLQTWSDAIPSSLISSLSPFIHFPSDPQIQLGDLGSAVHSHSRVWCGSPKHILSSKVTAGDNDSVIVNWQKMFKVKQNLWILLDWVPAKCV